MWQSPGRHMGLATCSQDSFCGARVLIMEKVSCHATAQAGTSTIPISAWPENPNNKIKTIKNKTSPERSSDFPSLYSWPS